MAATNTRVRVFFYGTFMHEGALAEHGVTATEVMPARLSGFKLNIRPRVNLARDDRSSVYGALAEVTHQDLAKIYAALDERFGLKYFPEPVIVETLDGAIRPALCYIAPDMCEGAADPDYVNELAQCVRSLGLPEWYAAYVESFRQDEINPAPVKLIVSFEEFNKIDVRVGTIERVEDIPKSNKLVKLVVNFGDHKRNILVGMKQERQDVKEIEGRQALFVVNLPPREMAGGISEGMLFDIGHADGIKPRLAVTEMPVPDGARAG